jgi:hypothetical protein
VKGLGLLENVGRAGCSAPHLLVRGCWIEPQEFTGVPPVPLLCRDSQASRLFHRGREGRGGRAVSFSNESTAKILNEKIHVLIGH